MTSFDLADWTAANQRYLTATLSEIRRRLERYTGEGEPPGVEHRGLDPAEEGAEMPAPPALETLCVLFGLSSFERNTLMLCAGVELDAAFGALCAAAHGDTGRPHATFGIALAVLPDAHWSALSPAAPLRHWRLVEVGGESLTRGPLRIDERVLHYLAGLDYLDERLEGFVEAVHDTEELLPSQRELAGRLAGTWSRSLGGTLPIAQVSGGDREDRLAVAAAACEEFGLALRMIPARNLPADLRELEALARLWERDPPCPQARCCSSSGMTARVRRPTSGRLSGSWRVLAAS